MKRFISVFSAIFVFFSLISSLHAQGVLNSIVHKIEDYKKNDQRAQTVLMIDRDIYSPSDAIWFFVSIHKVSDGKIWKGKESMNVNLIDAGNHLVAQKNFVIADGFAEGFFQLPGQINDGIYTLEAEIARKGIMTGVRQIEVKNKVTPPFVITMQYPEQFIKAGEPVPLSLEFKNMYNEPLKRVTYTASLFDGTKEKSTVSGKAKNGTAHVELSLKGPVKNGVINCRIEATAKNRTSSLQGILQLAPAKMFIDFFPQNGKLIGGVPGEVYFLCFDEFGQPIQMQGQLMDEGSSLMTLESDLKGKGHFSFTPKAGHQYAVQVDQPTSQEKLYELPKVADRGIGIQVDDTANTLSCRLLNGYHSQREVYLLALSEGKIIYSSAQTLDRELIVNVDVSSASGEYIHLAVINAADMVEGELLIRNPNFKKSEIEISDKQINATLRGKADISMHLSGEVVGGKLIFSAVHKPWISNDFFAINMLRDHDEIRYPEMLHHQLSDKDAIDDVHFAYPWDIAWPTALKHPGTYQLPNKYPEVADARNFVRRLSAAARSVTQHGQVRITNLTAPPSFAVSNPKYVEGLYAEKVKKVPAYQSMLQNGTNLLDVIKTIKPFNLQGTNIVFFGTNSSLNFQGGALIAIDGINRGTDASILNGISPYEVDKISVSTNPQDIQRYTGLNAVGVIEITLKKGEYVDEEADRMPADAQFDGPVYKSRNMGTYVDFRPTLMWKVLTVPPGVNSAEVIYYHADLLSEVGVHVIYVPEQGPPVSYRFLYKMGK